MTDPELTPAVGDTPGPFATPAQDADVRALLGTLRAEDVPMPDDVVRRINAAVVAERVASTLPDSPAALLDDEGTTGAGTATVTVLPSSDERRRSPYGRFTKVLAAAAGVLVVVGAGALLKGAATLSSPSASSAGASAAPGTPADAEGGGTTSGGGTVTASGGRYSADRLAVQAQGLVQGQAQTGEVVPAASNPSGPAQQPTATRSGLTSERYDAAINSALAACIAQLSGRDGVVPVAVDSGSYAGKPALVVVLPTADDAASLDVWVVEPTCGTTPDPTLIEFQRIARP